MSKKLATLTFGLLMLGVAFADEPVCRVNSIVRADNAPAARLLQKRPGDKEGFPVTQNSTGYVQDHYITDANTSAILEFLIGGRVAVNKNTDVEIVNERSVADGKTSVKRFILKNGAMYVKADAKTLKQPIEIQTNGGVMGIKGTEFTVEQNTDGTSRVCCFESNSEQGGVEIRDSSGKVVGVAKPGDEYLAQLKGAPVVNHRNDIDQFRTERVGGIFGAAQDYVNKGITAVSYAQMGIGALSALGVNMGGASYAMSQVSSGLYLASGAISVSQMDVERDPVGSAQQLNSLANSAGANTGPLGSVLGYVPRNNTPKEPDFPTNLSPDSTSGGSGTPTSGPFPQFSWKGTSDVDGYVVLLAKDPALDEIVFSDKTKSNSLVYPSAMRPLAKGTYYWRVVPVDDQDKPTQKATNGSFAVTS